MSRTLYFMQNNLKIQIICNFISQYGSVMCILWWWGQGICYFKVASTGLYWLDNLICIGQCTLKSDKGSSHRGLCF